MLSVVVTMLTVEAASLPNEAAIARQEAVFSS